MLTKESSTKSIVPLLGLKVFKAKHTIVPCSTKRLKLILDLIRFKDLSYAFGIMKVNLTKGGKYIAQLLKSIMSSIRNTIQDDQIDNMKVVECYCSKSSFKTRKIRKLAKGGMSWAKKRYSIINIAVKVEYKIS